MPVDGCRGSGVVGRFAEMRSFTQSAMLMAGVMATGCEVGPGRSSLGTGRVALVPLRRWKGAWTQELVPWRFLSSPLPLA